MTFWYFIQDCMKLEVIFSIISPKICLLVLDWRRLHAKSLSLLLHRLLATANYLFYAFVCFFLWQADQIDLKSSQKSFKTLMMYITKSEFLLNDVVKMLLARTSQYDRHYNTGVTILCMLWYIAIFHVVHWKCKNSLNTSCCERSGWF